MIRTHKKEMIEPTVLEKVSSDNQKNIGEISIHINYIRKDIDEMKISQQKQHEEIKRALSDLSTTYVTRTDFLDHLKKDDDHETRIRGLEQGLEDFQLVKKIVYGAITVVLLAFMGGVVYLVIPR